MSIDQIAVAFLALVSAIMSTFYTVPAGTPFPESASGVPSVSSEITVMSYNLRYGGSGEQSIEVRAPLVKQDIERYRPDSFGAQESTKTWLETMEEMLPEYERVGLPRYVVSGEASPVYYLKDKYELLDSGTFWISKTPDIPSRYPDAFFNRVCSYAVLKDRETGFIYAHFNTHLDHRGTYARMEAAAVISKKISKICPGIPVVLTGDLNEREDSVMYANFAECGFVNLRQIAEEKVNETVTTYHDYGDVDNEIIDYILTDPAYLVEAVKYVTDDSCYDGIYPSDHHPIAATMILQNYTEGE